jgi:hypothetical protein
MDNLTKESVHALHDAFKAGLLVVEEQPRTSLGISQTIFNQVGEPLLRWVHYRLLESAKWDPRPPSPNHPFRAALSISQIVRDETGLTLNDHNQYAGIVGDVSRVLKANGLLYIRGQKIWVKPWEGIEELRYVPTGHKIDLKVEKRIEEEADKPVTSRVDLRAFKAPDADPEKVLDFVSRFIPAALKVQQELTDSKQRVLELENQLAEIEEAKRLAEENTENWSGVSDTIGELLKG